MLEITIRILRKAIKNGIPSHSISYEGFNFPHVIETIYKFYIALF